MKRLRSLKFCAALVIIAWVATLVAVWGLQNAGRRAVASANAAAPGACKLKDLEGRGLQLEMARTQDAALKILRDDENGDARKGACIRSGMAAQIRVDYLLIPAYSGLTLALFFFVRALWIVPSGERKSLTRGLLVLGLLLALAMLVGDVLENRVLTKMIDLVESGLRIPADRMPDELFTALRYAGDVKWGALAASALLLALLWKSRLFPRLVWVLRLLGLAAAALLVTGLVRSDWEIGNWGIYTVSAFWLTALVHAVAIAVEPESIQTLDALVTRPS
jgi:hypothetical protein